MNNKASITARMSSFGCVNRNRYRVWKKEKPM